MSLAAGDVNGDGVADWLAGEPGNVTVYLQLGTPGPTPLPFPSLSYSELHVSYGASVGTAADWTGDGFSDVLVGAPDALGGGRIFVYRGSGATLAADPVFTLRKGQAGAGVGFGLGSAGDINHDGFSDFVTGAPGYESVPAEDSEGRVYVVYGGSCGPGCAAQSDTGVREGGQPGAQLGWSTSGAGDVNDDGFADVIAGAPTHDRVYSCAPFICTQIDAGQARVYLGGAGGLSASPAALLEGPMSGAQFGFSVAFAGDSTATATATSSSARLKPMQARAAPTCTRLAPGPDPLAGAHARGGVPGARFGISVASAGDVNGDGFSDVVVGADGYGVTGAAFLFLGEHSPTAWRRHRAHLARRRLPVELRPQRRPAGDVKPTASRTDRGAPTFPGWAAATGAKHDLSRRLAAPERDAEYDTAGRRAGLRLHALRQRRRRGGRRERDGFGDVIVGDQWYTGRRLRPGQGLRLPRGPGGSPPMLRAPSWTARPFCDFGRDVAGNLDVNGDGFSDVLIGGFKDSDGALYEGAAFVPSATKVAAPGCPSRCSRAGCVPVSLRGLANHLRAVIRTHSPAGRSAVGSSTSSRRSAASSAPT